MNIQIYLVRFNFSPDVVNIANLVTLSSPNRNSLKVTSYNNDNIFDKEEVNLSPFPFLKDYLMPLVQKVIDTELTLSILKLSIYLSKTLLKMKFLSSQKVFKLFLALNILIMNCSEKNLKILVGNLNGFFVMINVFLTLILLNKSPSLILLKIMLLQNFI